MLILGKHCFSNVKILHIIYLVPFLCGDGQRLQVGAVESGEHTQHLLVVLIVAHSLTIGFEEGHVLGTGEFAAKLINVAGLVVVLYIGILESLLRNKAHDVVIFRYTHHGSVHPSLVLGHKGKVGIGIMDDEIEHAVVEDKI